MNNRRRGFLGTLVAIFAAMATQKSQATPSAASGHFNLGDLVVLKSGGPKMKIIGFSPSGRLWCEWNRSPLIKDEASFVPAMLRSPI